MEEVSIAKEAKKLIDKSKRCPNCGRAYADLVITDVPTQTLNLFRNLADEEFSSRNSKGHYGFTLKFLLDFYFGRIVDGSAIAEAKADEALSQISELKTDKKEKKVIRLLNGKELNVGEINE